MSARALLQLSLVVALLTMGLKAAAWWLTGSVGLLSDALESIVNVAGAAFGLGMVHWAESPPDAEHPYGHHKAEYFSAGFEGGLILVAAVAMVVAAVDRWWSPQALQALDVGIGLSALSAVINGALATAMLRQSRRDRSVALQADARHLMTDVWTTGGVVVGLLAVMATGWHWIDPALAIAVALNVAREGLHLLRGAAGGLMDEALEPEVQAEIERTLQGFAHAVVRFDHLTTRRAGRRRFVDLHLHLPADWSLRRAAALRADVEQALMSAVPGLRATIQLLPADVEARFHEEKDPL